MFINKKKIKKKKIIQILLEQYCIQQSPHQMMTLGSGMVSGPKHHYH